MLEIDVKLSRLLLPLPALFIACLLEFFNYFILSNACNYRIASRWYHFRDYVLPFSFRRV